MDEGIPDVIGTTSFQDENVDRPVLAEPVCQCTAGRTAPDDHIVINVIVTKISFCHHDILRRSGLRSQRILAVVVRWFNVP